jgi:hypothetical protein
MPKLLKTDKGVRIVADIENTEDKVKQLIKSGNINLGSMSKAELIDFAKTCAEALNIKIKYDT